MKLDEIKPFLKTEKHITDKALAEFFQQQIAKAYAIDEYYGQALKTISAQVLRSGKRARPLLVRLAYELGKGDPTAPIVEASLFVELMHQLLLVHDDIADRDLERYGGPTLEVEFGQQFKSKFNKPHPTFGLSLAVIAGDLLQMLAHRILTSTSFSAEKVKHCEQIMADTIEQVAAGWSLHFWQNHVTLEQVSKDDYLKGMKLVSASYSFEAPLMIGLALAGNTNLKTPLSKYAYHTGMAFQIQDDILGVFGETQETGKPVGNDLREGKKTLLVLTAYQNGTQTQKAVLKSKIGQLLSDEDLSQLQTTIKETGALLQSQRLAQEHILLAKQALTTIKTDQPNALEKLEALAEFVVTRNH